MRDLTRSMASFTWALSLFGVRQMINLASPRRAADAFEAVARSAEGALGPGLRTAFQTGDRLQRAMVDASFSLVGMGPAEDGGPPGETRPSSAPGVLAQVGNLAFEFLQLGVTTVYQVSGTAWRQQQGRSGWGPVRQTDRRP
ncbi:MAG TPA: hypothetical protein VF414_00705 [Thermoanaerobaculia bacterium]